MKNLGLAIALTLILTLSGCDQSNPGNWTQDKVEAQLKKSLELTEVSISPAASGGYTGTGKTGDGETYTLTVTQNEAEKSMSWVANGDRGSMEEGNYTFE